MSGRVQLALNVNDIDQAVEFYSKLFGTGPAKLRPGYANFAIADPPLKLVLLENPGQGGSLNHLGIEVPDTGAVDAEQARLAAAGLAIGGPARYHLLLRPAGQVLGPGRARRRGLGDLHRPGRQPGLLRPRPRRPRLLRRRRRLRRAGRVRVRVLLNRGRHHARRAASRGAGHGGRAPSRLPGLADGLGAGGHRDHLLRRALLLLRRVPAADAAQPGLQPGDADRGVLAQRAADRRGGGSRRGVAGLLRRAGPDDRRWRS